MTVAPSASCVVASLGADDAGMPSSRATIAAWDVRPPRSVTMPAAVFMIGSQSGSVDLGDEDLAGLELAELARIADDARLARRDAVADGEALRRAARRAPSSA